MRGGTGSAIFFGLVAIAGADRFIGLPTARKVPFRALRYEVRTEGFRRGEASLAYGLGPAWEVDVRTLSLRNEPTRTAFDFGHVITPAFPGVVPGLAVGVLDTAGATADGRRFYAVATFRDTVPLEGGDHLYDLTIGAMIGRGTFLVGGVSLPLDGRNRLFFEWDGLRLGAAYEFRPVPSLGLRFIIRENQTMLSLTGTVRF